MSSNVFVIEDDSIFANDGLRGVVDHQFCDKNLIIGKNGAGKTRFLKSLEKYYSHTKSAKQVITLYFPEISATYALGKSAESEDSISLYDATYSDSLLSFQDFLKLVEQDGVSFLEDIYTGLNVRAKGTKQKRLEDLQKLNNFLLLLLGRTLLEEKEDGHIIMGSSTRPLALEEWLKELSPGELMLFYLSTFLFYLNHISGEDRKVILLMDEPELHLHPKALLAMLSMLESCDMVDQLWIASHSIFILPRFPFEGLVYLHQSEVLKLSSTTYQCVYDDLVGLENVDMHELLSSIENWKNYHFIVENFLLPHTRGNANRKDEQTLKVLKILEKIQAERPLQVLDYGAGQCRVWECLKLAVPNKNTRDHLLSYKAYDIYPSKKRPKDVTYYTAKEKVRNPGKYDVVILMNVLHEIEPEDWCEVFSTIHYFLNGNGILVFLEVLSLTNGEQPYGQAGFLLLRDRQVKELFPNAQSEKLPNCLTAEKSNCWVIPASDLDGVQNQQVYDAIRSLEVECEALLKEIDEERVTMAHSELERVTMDVRKQKARQYAFLAQQFINAHIVYQRLGNKTERKHSSVTGSKREDKIDFPGLVTDTSTLPQRKRKTVM